MYGVAIALRPVLCEDIGQMIQDIVTHDRERFHAEYFHKLAKFIENKIDAISVMMCMYVSEETDEQREWSYILDDIFYNSNKVVNSPTRIHGILGDGHFIPRPDPTIM